MVWEDLGIFKVYFPTPFSEIDNPANDNIDVCVRTQDGKQYTLVFVTPDNLKTLMASEDKTYIHPNFRFIVVKSITEECILSALNEIVIDIDLLQQLGGD